MPLENNILIRRQLLDWRDKHIDNIYHHLSRELYFLYESIDKEFKKIAFLDIINSQQFIKDNIDQIYIKWVENESIALLKLAQDDLNRIFQFNIKHNELLRTISSQHNNEIIYDATLAVVSTGASLAAIPALISLSTATVSSGGILGILGVTTTVINWPVVALGGSLLLTLSHFGVGKAINLKDNEIKRMKNIIKKSIRKQAIDNNTSKSSVCDRLQLNIYNTAETLIRELDQQ